MAKFIVLGFLIFGFGNASGAKIAVNGDSVVFQDKLPESGLRKKVKIKGATALHSAMNWSMKYDTSRIKIFEVKNPLTPADSLNLKEWGLFSRRWAVKEKEGSRYLNLSDLKRMGLKRLDGESIHRWIIGGKRVTSGEHFRSYVDELKQAGIWKGSLPENFSLGEDKELQGYRYTAITVYDMGDFSAGRFIKFQYLVSQKGDAMLLRQETLFEIAFPTYIAHPAISGAIILANPSDSLAAKRSDAFNRITNKYEERIFSAASHPAGK